MLVSVLECGDVSKVCVCMSVCVFQIYPICLSKCPISCETAIHAHRNIAEYVNMYGHHYATLVAISVGTELACYSFHLLI